MKWWTRYFFVDKVLLDDFALVDVQRRAVWIGVALILQSLVMADQLFLDIDRSWFALLQVLFNSLVPLALTIGSFVAVWNAIRPVNLLMQRRNTAYLPIRWQRVFLALMLLLVMIGSVMAAINVVGSFQQPQFKNDGASLDTNAALLLIQGHNPYTDSSILDIARRWHIAPSWTTPLRLGRFAQQLEYPSSDEFASALYIALKTGNASEFESRVSYPALAFLVLVPFAFLHLYNVMPFFVLTYLLIIIVAWKAVRHALRPWVLLLAVANVPMWSLTTGLNVDLFYVLLVMLAWLLRDKRWASSLFLGLAIASKQNAWLFVPFFLLLLWRDRSLKEALYRFVISGSIGLAINLPFIVWNPQAWLAGVLAPIADPMFPRGIGIISLSIVHLLPYFPSWVYLALVGCAMLLALMCYWRVCRSHPEAVMVLATLPLLFGWRSLPSYFCCIAFPTFVLMAMKYKSALKAM